MPAVDCQSALRRPGSAVAEGRHWLSEPGDVQQRQEPRPLFRFCPLLQFLHHPVGDDLDERLNV